MAEKKRKMWEKEIADEEDKITKDEEKKTKIKEEMEQKVSKLDEKKVKLEEEMEQKVSKLDDSILNRRKRIQTMQYGIQSLDRGAGQATKAVSEAQAEVGPSMPTTSSSLPENVSGEGSGSPVKKKTHMAADFAFKKEDEKKE
ncbi:unnamed protein product [Meloidogyne enterolobii]|uniref:Uncharacterized protein n=1 Tax=Meloidogyne enterolobii TaxID=390850 RepID=A0ACB0Y3L6_MELEN